MSPVAPVTKPHRSRSRRSTAVAALQPLAGKLPSGYHIARHYHPQAQLIFASSGVMRIATPDGIRVISPVRAVWVPAGVEHEVRVSSAVELRTLLIDPSIDARLPSKCCVIDVSALLRELIVRVSDLGAAIGESHMVEHLLTLILAEIHSCASPVRLPMPADPRLVRVCRSILDHPSDKRTCAQWGLIVGASARTLERRFFAETGISFGAWRRQARLVAALDQLAAQTPVAKVAVDLGYRSASAFSVMFKHALGRRPSDFFPQPKEELSRGEEP